MRVANLKTIFIFPVVLGLSTTGRAALNFRARFSTAIIILLQKQ